LSATTALVTFADFENLPRSEFWRELLDGTVITLPPPKFHHSGIVHRLQEKLPAALNVNRSRVYVETGFLIEDNWVIPDVSVLHANQSTERGYLAGAPMIAIEVASKGNTAEELDRKVQLYLGNGAEEVWILYPRTRTLLIHEPGGSIVRATECYRGIDLADILQ